MKTSPNIYQLISLVAYKIFQENSFRRAYEDWEDSSGNNDQAYKLYLERVYGRSREDWFKAEEMVIESLFHSRMNCFYDVIQPRVNTWSSAGVNEDLYWKALVEYSS